jgi:hypothetical protein
LRRAVYLLALALGCGGKGALTAKDFPAAFAQAVCQVEKTCHRGADYLEQQCETDLRPLYDPDLAKAIAAGKSSFDPQQAQSCIDGLRAAGCERTPMEVQQACERAVLGKVADKSACSWTWECTNGRCEPSAPGACPATCAGASGEGAPCQPGCDLRQGLRCIENICSKLHAIDQKCGSDDDCVAGLYCSALGKCSQRASEQASCQTDAECAPGLFCDRGSEGGLCHKRSARGASCTTGSPDAIALACADGLLCKGFSFAKSGTMAGTCAPIGQIGAQCVASAQVTGCAEGLDCNAATCADKPQSGACSPAGDCKDGIAYCDGTQCRLLKASGVACAASPECASRFCDPSSGQCRDNDPACHEP